MEKTKICNKGVAFTGHRDILCSKRRELRQRLSFCVRNLYHEGMLDFYCGMLCKALHKQPYVH